MPEPGQLQVEPLLCSRELLFQSPGEHRGSAYSEDELHVTKKRNVTQYCQLTTAYGALNLDRGHMKTFVSPLNPVPQHHSLRVNRCLCGSCPSSQPVSQLVDSKFPLFYICRLHFGAHACFRRHMLQSVS